MAMNSKRALCLVSDEKTCGNDVEYLSKPYCKCLVSVNSACLILIGLHSIEVATRKLRQMSVRKYAPPQKDIHHMLSVGASDCRLLLSW
jgi:hypothetical protein